MQENFSCSTDGDGKTGGLVKEVCKHGSLTCIFEIAHNCTRLSVVDNVQIW